MSEEAAFQESMGRVEETSSRYGSLEKPQAEGSCTKDPKEQKDPRLAGAFRCG